MNRDTRTDGLEKSMHNAGVTTGGQFRKLQNPVMHATIPEANKGVNFRSSSNFAYCFCARDSQRIVLDRHAEGKNVILRSASFAANPRTIHSCGDLRRNLYVLGLPFDLTKSDFTKIFEPYGTVTHAVILATLDSASRRRGFIVMSTHQEARVAMDTLSRTQIKFFFDYLPFNSPYAHLRGHMLDVSWAVVQRSQGFLDGADRSMMLAISAPSSIPECDRIFPFPSGPEDRINDHLELTHVPTSKLMVSNLSTMLFTQVSDLHPLFYPFGPIKELKILGTSHIGPFNGSITAIVEYLTVSNAKEAKEALQCQSYAGYPIEVHYICDAGAQAHVRSSNSSLFSGSLSAHGKSSDLGLNPFAIPFHVSSLFSTASQVDGPGHNATIPSGLPLPSDVPLAPQPFLAHMRPYVMDSISRSSSATSSTWSYDGRLLGLPRALHSSVNANTYA